MNESTVNSIVNSLTPLHPLSTDLCNKLYIPADIRAVLFDVYGTLLISGSGDIGTLEPWSNTEKLSRILHESGYPSSSNEMENIVPAMLKEVIGKHHHQSRLRGTDFPEVDIREIWSEVLDILREKGLLDCEPEQGDIDTLALRYETVVNPVWPMPGFPDINKKLSQNHFKLGIVSNAQFYTPILMEALADSSLSQIGFLPELCEWSYQLRKAKPSPDIFTKPLNSLKTMGISSEEVLFVGNDMLNDVLTASKSGCRTCLFAGDRRSLKLREAEIGENFEPDMVINDLSLLECLIPV